MKVLVNDKKLKIVLVSSEGLVKPLLEDISGTNYSIKTIEVLDISDGEAINYLVH